MKWGSSFEGQFWSLFQKWFDICKFATSTERIKFDREVAKVRYWSCHLLEIDQINYQCQPANLNGFKIFKIFNIFSRDASKNTKFKPLNLILSRRNVNLDSLKVFGEERSLDTKFCARLEKKFLEMDQFFVSSKAISFLSFKQMSDADVALDGNTMDFKAFQSSLG